jgi:hypothetical protein
VTAGPLRKAMGALHWSRTASLLLLCAAFWLAAVASMAGFMAKWGFHDGRPDFGFEAMLDRTAEKPYVYRQLLPVLSGLVARVTPPAVKERLVEDLHPGKFYARVETPTSTEVGFRYVVVYYLTFAALLASLFCLRRAALDAGAARLPAIVAPILFALALPYVQTRGGFFYDSVELLCLAAAFLLARADRAWWIVLLALPATFNKESFFFFLPALYPLLREHASRGKALAVLGCGLLAAGAVNAATKMAFLDAPGGVAIWQLWDNVRQYLHPAQYFRLENTYALVGPKGLSMLAIVIVALVVARGWPACPLPVRRHVLLAAAINVPLFLAFAAPGELRNLSFLFVAFAVLIALAITRTAAH